MRETGLGNVGRRLRQLREAQGRTLRETARVLGISPASLSAMENGRGGVSLRRLQAVAEYYGLHVTELLAPGEGHRAPADGSQAEVFRESDGLTSIQRGRGVLYQLWGSPAGHTVQAYTLAFQPGTGFESDQIGHAGEEFAYVMLGRVELMLGSRIIELSQGEGARFRTATPHAFRNASPSRIAVVIGVASPPW